MKNANILSVYSRENIRNGLRTLVKINVIAKRNIFDGFSQRKTMSVRGLKRDRVISFVNCVD